MAKFIVVKDGCIQELTSAQYKETFGVTPVAPAESGTHSGDLFGGRYSHNTFSTGSVDSAGYQTDASTKVNTGRFDPSVEFLSGSVKR